MSDKTRICAGIVLYNPDIERLSDNIDSVISQVEKIYLVDNGSKNINKIEQIFRADKIVLIPNEKNEGIATALNQLVTEAKANGYTWILTLDQDSVCRPDLIENYRKYISLPDIGILTCNIIDRNFGIESSTNQAEYEECKFCITSGSLMNVEILEQMGGFDEIMFIDKVDYDICLTMRENGKRILRVNYNGLLHEIGHAQEVKVGSLRLLFFQHPPFRRYYIARNSIYCAKKHKSLSILRESLIALLDVVLVFVFEENKVAKLKASIKGLYDGFRIKVGT